jgi:hypothetical protein
MKFLEKQLYNYKNYFILQVFETLFLLKNATSSNGCLL